MRWRFWQQASGVDVELDRLERRVRRMDAMTRAVFLMHRLDSLGYAEIAQRLGIAVGEVERRIAEAMVVLIQADAEH
ncbi:sigma factor-like helix-turn-helix DNA-binding protein [Sphingomonas sp.]|jgi:DNA-directed RNA polymerase specialized sigma24 family protein|uniref:sigma factor-like helix-turn-helix DNA-binding protein n=1 Tax=Sphingomonas sp. TaxID=28214 RepID=UPI002E12ACBC|nr:sigma factor-like helix-turn-helix DNA-binding protein [Sphingomonas sp.]HEV7290100.1 sigma factor-like helix-turn-helix DNA-binding protein [Sphingomonas sp.]